VKPRPFYSIEWKNLPLKEKLILSMRFKASSKDFTFSPPGPVKEIKPEGMYPAMARSNAKKSG
jgi:hypothetical protein